MSSAAHVCVIPVERFEGRFPNRTALVPIGDRGELICDHPEMIELALEDLRARDEDKLDPDRPLGETFTLQQLRFLHGSVDGETSRTRRRALRTLTKPASDMDQRATRSLFQWIPMSGHLFVLRGDLTHLRCSAVLVPCDSRWFVVWDHWSQLLPDDRLGPRNARGWRALTDGGTGRFADLVTDGDKWVRLVVTASTERFDSPEARAGWVSQGVTSAIADLSTRGVPLPAGRIKPLIALPLVGTGAGGFETTRGVLIHELLPALIKAAREHDVDIALVLIDQRDHAAVQAVRTDYWAEFAEEQPEIAEYLDIADELGRRAADGELSLFLGSGVSVPLGLPDWKTLLSNISPFAIDFQAETLQQIAKNIEHAIGRDELEQRIVRNVRVDGVAPAHLLLAALAVPQVVTTNYDTAYERALETTEGRGKYRVLTGQLALQGHPWLLKYHGCINRPGTIVITTTDYEELKIHYGALQAVVESLMITSHLMFVGFSMEDEEFVDAARRVKVVRDLAEDSNLSSVATVLALHPHAVSTLAGFDIVPMLNDPDSPKEAARRLEIFLDRVSWRATTKGPASSSYLLHPDYQDLFAKDVPTNKFRERLLELANELETDYAFCHSSRGWNQVTELLAQLGRRSSDQRSP
ncbi:MAG: SIR2 family protein [Actinomycetia bacterium]|nr:SIR2 family protein [Actinomycetes bacterium]